MRRVVKETGLVPVRLLAPKGVVNAGEIAGFLPGDAAALVDAGAATYDLDALETTADDAVAAEQAAAEKAAADKAAADKAKA